MAEIKLTKNELRDQQKKMHQLQRYLPTLQLKKAMLQAEVHEARLEIVECENVFHSIHQKIAEYSALYTDPDIVRPKEAAAVEKIEKHYENIAGIEVPYFDGIHFKPLIYDLFSTPPWTDALIEHLRALIVADVRVGIAREKKAALEKELREVSIRVNLFEKILIPRAERNIKKIKVFLGDQQLAAVSQAKVAKGKIEEKKKITRDEVEELSYAC